MNELSDEEIQSRHRREIADSITPEKVNAAMSTMSEDPIVIFGIVTRAETREIAVGRLIATYGFSETLAHMVLDQQLNQFLGTVKTERRTYHSRDLNPT